MSTASSLSTDDLASAAQRDRRKRILDAADALASEGGFDAVQMRAVADRAGVALGTLYRYFPSKIQLLVSALGRQFEEAAQRLCAREIQGGTAADRVLSALERMTRGLQAEPRRTEALTRAFMFADAGMAPEIRTVGRSMAAIVTHALHGTGRGATTDEDGVIARVICDVWLSAVMSWVTGRSTAAEMRQHLEVAVRLIVR